MAHDHRDGVLRAGERHLRPLLLTFGLIAGVMAVEIVGGILTNSLALLSDAGHMGTDAVGLGMALAAIIAASRVGASSRHTFGLYRVEILAALVNALLLFGIAAYVLAEGIRRFQDPPSILAGPMLAVAALGLAANVIGWRLLRDGASESLNVEGAFMEVVADLVGSVGVIAAAVISLTTGWEYVDPVFGVGIGVLIVPRAWRLARKALRVLVQAAPPELDLGGLHADMQAIPGVMDVHDVHVWTLTSDMEVASMHLRTSDDTDTHRVLDEARDILRDRYHIAHATLQVEPESHDDCSASW